MMQQLFWIQSALLIQLAIWESWGSTAGKMGVDMGIVLTTTSTTMPLKRLIMSIFFL
jgi:hypothetical protein